MPEPAGARNEARDAGSGPAIDTAAFAELAAARRPGWSLDQRFYMDEGILRLEMDRIFRRGWLLAGHSCQIAKPGDYLTCEISGESILVVRGADAIARAYFNVCRHRGARLCRESSGRMRQIVCPYHQWVYGLDGELLHTTWMGEDFDPSRFGLHPAHVEELDGLLFVSTSDEPWDFEPVRSELSPVLRPHDLANTQVAHVYTYEVAANWKLVVENQRECYHCRSCHPEYVRLHYDADIDDPEMQPEIAARLEEAKKRWESAGVDVSSVSTSSQYTGLWFRANRTPFRPGFVTESLDGQPVAPLLGRFTEADMGTARVGTYLNFWLHATSDHAASIRYTPVGPTRTRLTATWLVRRGAAEGADYELDRLTAFTKVQLDQDRDLLDRQGLGVLSSRYRSGPYSPVKESNVERFVSWYLGVMSRPPGAGNGRDDRP
jgi:Rieske 2Fe-2S family protein